ncbi:calcineurin-like phosphoesterase [Hortaea werneckii]|nr:calcineurin-like phosphoesterase [Hortaea werneckii]
MPPPSSPLSLFFFFFLHLASAAQPSAPSPISAPLRSLPWASGKNSLNFLHTTDTHGWHAGHLQEPQYSADWGDYISFASHLHDRADADGSDLLLIDTGDRVEGNGLYDASDPKGYWTFNGIFEEQPIDVITSGNHELYLANTSRRESDVVVPAYRQNYIASNLDISHLDADGQDADFHPLAARYRKFTTKNNGIRILAFGFLFNFHNNANNTRVQPVQETIKEKWFQDALREKDVDLFLVAGHVPVRESEEYDAVYRAIRTVKWDTPIVFFGGHTHIRDFKRWEDKAMGIESGRYLETIGFLSMKGLKGSGHKEGDVDTEDGREDGEKEEAIASTQRTKKSIQYSRMYIDNNLHSFHHHSNTTSDTFPTEHGRNVSARIEHARQTLNLNQTYGCVPQTYWLNRAPYPSNNSLLSLLADRILPESFASLYNATTSSTIPGDPETSTATDDHHHSHHKPCIILTNTGALRFDLFEGPFTLDSTFLISPFTSGFRMIRDVPFPAADRVLGLLNSEGPIFHRRGEDGLAFGGSGMEQAAQEGLVRAMAPQRGFAGDEENGREVESRAENTFGHQEGAGGQIPLLSSDKNNPEASLPREKETQDDPPTTVPGYTTHDDLGAAGDDTLHVPIRFYDVPNCIGSKIFFPTTTTTTNTTTTGSGEKQPETPPSPHPEKVDVIYNAFIEPWVLSALAFLGEEYDRQRDTEVAGDGRTMTEVISGWVGEEWGGGCEGDEEEGEE